MTGLIVFVIAIVAIVAIVYAVTPKAKPTAVTPRYRIVKTTRGNDVWYTPEKSEDDGSSYHPLSISEETRERAEQYIKSDKDWEAARRSLKNEVIHQE